MRTTTLLMICVCYATGCSSEQDGVVRPAAPAYREGRGDADGLDRTRMGRDAYSKLTELVPEDRYVQRSGPEYDKALRIGRELVAALKAAPDDVRAKEVAFFATRIGKGTPEVDFYWLCTSDTFSMLCLTPSLFEPTRSLQLEVAQIQVPFLLSDRVAFERYAQSVAWMGRVFSPRFVIFGSQYILGGLKSLQSPDSFPRDGDGDPTSLFWWDARKALIYAKLCDSDNDFDDWTAQTIDKDFTAWLAEWNRAREKGLVRPGRLFGWRIDRSPNARPISVLPHPMIPELPFEKCRFQPMGHHDEQ